ncbi:pleckstrin (PH) domain-containing protein [Tieghemostelium lacteum]|uniref:Pleckstrin (PH) domain-containing protein n=1 Tax=Tieghemostelium lacteum TaxID=361077 RepID=A0A152A8R9_TIELA|nr:pleckstrin (PH) domain-containing protein [Tieghemostelium lacteum]|eukprot:KYR02602.1 pleckstrin (PH) domain-containing protein [Tieghemostelium lacteum]
MERINAYISRLSSSDISVQESSLRTLINYSIEPQLLLAIYNEIKIDIFKQLLKSENEVIQMLTIWLLSHLCGSIYISSDVLKSQSIVDEVLKLLEIENEDISEKILWFLENLTMNPNHSFLLGDGVIISLIEFLRYSNAKLVQLCAKPLIHLLHKETCGDYLNNQQIFIQNQGIQVIQTILTSKYPVADMSLIQPLVSILHVLSIYLPKIRILIAEPALLAQLISLFSLNSTQEIKDTTMMILVNLSLTEEAENPIFESGAIMPLLDIVASISSSEVLRYHAISCLANLTSNPRIRTVLRSRYLIDSLCEILKEIDGSSDEYSMILGAISVLLSNLCIDEICRYRALQTDIHQLLIKLVNYPHPQVRDSIQRTLENLREPIPQEILNQFNQESIEDESDDFEDQPLILNTPNTPDTNQNVATFSLNGASSLSSSHSNLGIYNTNSNNAISSPPIRKGIYRLSTFTSPSRVSSNNLLNGANTPPSNDTLTAGNHSHSNSHLSLPNVVVTSSNSQSSQSLLSPNRLIGSPPQTQNVHTISPPLPPLVDEPSLQFRRGKIIKEIMDTEQAYVHSLGICIRVYFNPLVVQYTNPPIIPKQTVETIFSNIDKVFRINCEFLKKLRLVVSSSNANSQGNSHGQLPNGNISSSSNIDTMEVAQAFLWLWNQQSTIYEYRHYINGFNKAMESVHENRAKVPRFKEFLDKCQFSDQCKSETIDSYLIRPIQRLPRYILLLTDLLAHTVDMLERNSIEDALERTKQIVDLLNESKRKAENFTKTLMLQQKFTNLSEYESKLSNNNNIYNTIPRNNPVGNGVVYTKQIVREGLLMQFLKSKPSQYRYLILYNDQLFITIQKKDKYHILQIIPLLDLKIIYLSNPSTTVNATTLSGSSSTDSIVSLSSNTSTTSNSNTSTATTVTTNTLPENSFQLLWSSAQDTFEREMLLYTSTPEERDNWVKEIRDTCNSVKKTHIENIIKSQFKQQQQQQYQQLQNTIQVEI